MNSYSLYLKAYQKQIITKFACISKKYEDTLCDNRSRNCIKQDLYNLYECDVKSVLGDDLGKKVFKESLIEYCGFAYGVTLFENLFSNRC